MHQFLRPSNSLTVRGLLRAAAAAGMAIALVTVSARAQGPTGRIAGKVTSESGAPLSGAQLSVAGSTLGTVSGTDGRFRIVNVPAGSHDVRVQRIGQKARTLSVMVRAGEETSLDVTMETAAVTLGGVVVESGDPREVLSNPQRQRTKDFLSKVL